MKMNFIYPYICQNFSASSNNRLADSIFFGLLMGLATRVIRFLWIPKFYSEGDRSTWIIFNTLRPIIKNTVIN